MHIAWDADIDALYITLVGPVGRFVDLTVEVDDNTNVDLDSDGTLLGIEVLSPRRLWPLGEILQRWDVKPEDAAMLMGCYPCTYSLTVA
jgi:uncharacterized protein YuzE